MFDSPMKATDNLDHVLIRLDPFLPGIGNQHTVAKYDPDTNTVEVVDGYAEYLPRIVEAVRGYKKERNIPAAPVRVLYW